VAPTPAITEKISYLKDLGVTAVELMPAYQFDPQEGNYWGYMPLSFFAAHSAYAASGLLWAGGRISHDGESAT